MKLNIGISILVSLLQLSNAVQIKTVDEFQKSLQLIDQTFVKQGATIDVLNQYDQLLIDSQGVFQIDTKISDESLKSLARLYHKKGILEVSLGKESKSIKSFIKSLELDKENKSVRSTVLKLILKYGYKDDLNKILALYEKKEIDPELKEVVDSFDKIDELIKGNKLDDITQAINISPFDSKLRLFRIEIITDLIKKSSDDFKSTIEQFNSLIDDYSNLINLSPISKSINLNKLSEIYLFAELKFANALNLNKKCLHFDLDNDQCKQNSKILNKFKPILNNLSNSNKIYQVWDNEETEELDYNEDEFKQELIETVKLLSDPNNFLKIRRMNEEFKDNLSFLSKKSNEFNNFYKLHYNTFDLTILKNLILNSYLSKDSKTFTKNSIKLYKLNPKIHDEFLPIILNKAKDFIKQKNFDKANELLTNVKPNVKSTNLYKELHKIVIQHLQQRQQQQRQQQHQQQQHQYRQQQQQAQRQPPKNDYYKVLEVSKDADLSTIKKAYRDKLKIYHPDKYRGDLSNEEIENKMTLINHAYEVLSDEELRKNYDMGEDPNDPDTQRGGGHGHNPFNGGGGGSQGFNPFGNGGFQFQFGNGGNGGSKFGKMRYKKRSKPKRNA